jgi:hypothetical protein
MDIVRDACIITIGGAWTGGRLLLSPFGKNVSSIYSSAEGVSKWSAMVATAKVGGPSEPEAEQ